MTVILVIEHPSKSSFEFLYSSSARGFYTELAFKHLPYCVNTTGTINTGVESNIKTVS